MNRNFRAQQIFGWLVPTALLIFVAAESANARQEMLAWDHSNSSAVQVFEAHVGTSTGAYNQVFNLGKPSPDATGVFTATIDVADGDTVFIVLRAIGFAGETSPFSNERVRVAPPPPDSSGNGTSAAAAWGFEQDPIGTIVSNWIDTGANFSLATNDNLFEVMGAGAGHVLTTSSTLSNIHSHVLPAPATLQNYRLRGSFSVGSDSGGIGFTFYSSFPSAAAYYRLGRSAGGPFRFESLPTGLSCILAGLVPQANASYLFEIEVSSYATSNLLRAKIWDKGGAEPTAMQISCTDDRPDRPTGGTVGVWADGAGSKYWDDFTLESLGSVLPPLPVALAAPVLISVEPLANP